MKTIVYSTRPYDREYLEMANRGVHELHFHEAKLESRTAVLAQDFPVVCCFVDDELDSPVLKQLRQGGTKLITLRATGFNNVDLRAAEELGLTVMRVSHYSPYAVAEFAAGMILSLSRNIHRAYNRVREGNFLLDGLLGFDINGKTVGIVGTGKIGSVLARIMHGFGCQLLGYDMTQDQSCLELGMRYVPLNELLAQSDIVSLHAPLISETHHMIKKETLSLMKPGAVLINTSRGALVDTRALIWALKKHQLSAVGMDVYEEESHIYFRDLSDQIIPDDVIARLMTFPNVLITGHQAFFTREALIMIAQTTIQNISAFAVGRGNENILESRKIVESSPRKR
jgi:D-lactate dehydrogenase